MRKIKDSQRQNKSCLQSDKEKKKYIDKDLGKIAITSLL